MVSKRRQTGLAYMWLLFGVVIMSILVGASLDVWSTGRQRERENELIWTGQQYRTAIQHYYETSPGSAKRYPGSLEELLSDKRFLTIQRHLRKLYPDPMTGRPDWELLKAPDGGVMGVASQSKRKPIKVGRFGKDEQDFVDKKSYSEWKFIYTPQAAQTAPGTTPPTKIPQ